MNSWKHSKELYSVIGEVTKLDSKSGPRKRTFTLLCFNRNNIPEFTLTNCSGQPGILKR